MKLTEQRYPRHEYEIVRGVRREKRLPSREIKILLALVAAAAAALRVFAARGAASRINLSIIESRRSPFSRSPSVSFRLSFPRFRTRFRFSFLPLAPDRVLNHARNKSARDIAQLLITGLADLAIKMRITFVGLKFYSRGAARPCNLSNGKYAPPQADVFISRG